MTEKVLSFLENEKSRGQVDKGGEEKRSHSCFSMAMEDER